MLNTQKNRTITRLTRISKFMVAIFVVLFVHNSSANAQSQEINPYWFNAQSTPVRIIVKKSSRADRLDEFLENVSNGSVTQVQFGCINLEENRFDVVSRESIEKIAMSPKSLDKSTILLPKGSHGNYLSICRGSAKVTILAVSFADGAKWTIE